jgi:hypothetical protein
MEKAGEKLINMQVTIDKMWAAMAEYQPTADADGHGETWALMCSDRTINAAYAAGDAAKVTNAWTAAYAAAWAVAASADAVAWAVNVADTAIDYINKAQGKRT